MWLGVLDPRDRPKYFTCLAFSSSGDLVTGDSSGNIFVWGRGYNAVTKALWAAHEGPVFRHRPDLTSSVECVSVIMSGKNV